MNRCISEEEVIETVTKLNRGTASDPDGVVAEMLKAGRVEVVQFLIKLFRYIFDNGIIIPKRTVKGNSGTYL